MIFTRRKSLLLLAAPAIIRARAQVPTTHAGKGAPGGGGGSLPNGWTFTAAPAPQNTGTNSVTWSGVNIGTPDATRVVVAAISTHTNVVTSLTINGIGATQAIATAVIAGVQIWYLGVASGTTATIAASATGGAMNDQAIIVGVMGHMSTPPPPTDSSAGADDPAGGASLTIATGGVGVWALWQQPGSAGTWGAGGILDAKNTIATVGNLTVAHVPTSGTQNPTYAGLSGNNWQMVSAAWGP